MRIVLATPIYPPEIGGPANYVPELARRLASAHEITIVAYTQKNPQTINGVKLVSILKTQALLLRLTQFFFALLREGKQVDIIYVQNAVAAGLPAVLAGLWLHKPVVLKFVGDEAWERATQAGLTTDILDTFLSKPLPSVKSRIFFRIQKYVLSHVSRVVPPSKFLGDILTKRYQVPASRVKVNYNPAALSQEAMSATRMPHQVSVACRLVVWKHVDGIVRAVHTVRHHIPNASLVVAGDGPERAKLEALVTELHAESYVRFLGKISQDEARALQAQSGAHVLNSTYEGLPFEVLNSFAVRTPVVATNIPCTNELVRNEDTGLTIQPGDDEALAAAIEKIFTEPELRERLIQNGATLLKEQFSWEKHIETLLAVFTAVQENN